jgi:hypothetical protein
MESSNQLQKIDDSPQGLIAIAIQQNLDIEKLERLLALKERYDAQQASKSFIAAMSSFQKQVAEIPKSKQVGYTNRSGGSTSYKYAELGTIDEVIKAPMAANGMTKRWEIKDEAAEIFVTCIISHVDGHQERTTMSSAKDASGGKNDIQSKASAITYLQRYTLIGALGLTTASEDNDGDGAAPPSITHQQQEQNLPWLNVTEKDGSYTEIGLRVVNAIAAGNETIDNLKQQFKISKSTSELLATIKQGQTFTSPNDTPDTEPVPGHWYAKLDKCKSKEEIDHLALSNKATIEANPELKKVFQQYYNALKKQTTNV